MGRRIAVLATAINIDNQKKLLEGMIDAAKEADSSLFVFTCHIRNETKEENRKGAYRIMTLPDFRSFDGAVIVRNTFQDVQAAKEVLIALQESGIPAVSIDAELPGLDYIGVMNYEAQYGIVEHLITAHGCRDICYVAGPSYNEEARDRRRAYEDALKDHGIVLREENVAEGLWDNASGYQAAKHFLERQAYPEAIVCANDQMAAGVFELLHERGCRVPEDVRVTGFDNEELSELLLPALTTVDKNQYGVGREAVLTLCGREKGRALRRVTIPFRPVFRASCGCGYGYGDKMDVDWLKKKHVSAKLRTQTVENDLKNMISDFTGIDQPDELIASLKEYVQRADMESFYLCLCDREKIFGTPRYELGGEVELQQINADFTEEMTIPLAYEDGEFRSYGAFPRGRVIPEECESRLNGGFYVVVPIHYQQHCFGYCVSGNSRYPLEEGLYYLWMINIGIGLENIRKRMLLRAAMTRLGKVWAYDMLTGLYNRAGFYHMAAPMLEELSERKAEVFVIFMDLDGLKEVNDTCGHERGDLLIVTVADIVQESIGEGELAMRYGGDEFVIFGEQRGGRMEELIARIRAGMDAWNRAEKEITVSASIGGTCFAAERDGELDMRIEEADRRMYRDKREKRKRVQNGGSDGDAVR